jgi:2-hydroxycyclohexanecarboxyl-CoA dehydrogenase
MTAEGERQVVVVTGGANGIGREIARRLHAENWKVAILDNDEGALASTLAQVGGERSFRGWAVNVADHVAVEAVVGEIENDLGPIAALINNALWVSGEPFLEMPEASFRRTIDSSLIGYFVPSQIVARRMVQRRYGRIVNMSSGSAERGIPRTGGYASAKGGVNALTRVIAVELAQYGVVANILVLGPIATDTGRRLAKTDEGLEARRRRVPMGRLGDPDDYIGAVRYLISPALRWTTGSTLYCDGGANGAALVISVAE